MKLFSYKYSKIVLSLFFIIILTGCWDYKEIENRGYVLGIAIDKPKPLPKGYEDQKSYKQEKKLEKMELQQGDPQYAYTVQIPILPKAQVKPIGGGGGGGGAESSRSWDLTLLGNSFFEANREFSTRLNYAPFYEHLKVIIINEKVAREGIIPPLDMILRDPEMRRRTKVFVTSEEAHKILDVTPRIDDYAAMYLADLPRNATKTSRMPHITDLGEVAESLHGQVDFGLPIVISTSDEIKIIGAAAFKGDKMVGRLSGIQTIYAKWIRDAIKGGVIVIKARHNPNILLTLELKKVKTKLRPIVDGDNVKILIKSKAVINLAEESETRYKDALKQDFIKNIEQGAKDEIESNIKETIKYVQQELGADIFHFKVILQKFAPKTWEQVEDDWYEVFRNLDIVVDVDVELEYIGTVK